MKRSLLVFATVVAIVSLSSLAVQAQVPYVQVFFDLGLSQPGAVCPTAPSGTVMDTCHVAAVNFGMWIAAAELMIATPPEMLIAGTILPAGALTIGTYGTGLALSYPIPLNGFQPAVLFSLSFLWMCSDCTGGQQNVDVLAHPMSGLVQLIDWPDMNPFTGVGMRSLICPTVPVEDTSWGQIKNLYN